MLTTTCGGLTRREVTMGDCYSRINLDYMVVKECNNFVYTICTLLHF